jgi:hypothetical protein
MVDAVRLPGGEVVYTEHGAGRQAAFDVLVGCVDELPRRSAWLTP